MKDEKGDSPETAAKRNFPGAGEESREIFGAALDLTSHLLERDLVFAHLDANGDLRFTADSEAISKLSSDEFSSGLTSTHFMTLLETELGSLLRASLYHEPDTGLQEEVPARVLKKVGKDEFKWRLAQFIKRGVLPDKTKQVALLRKTTKGFVLGEIKWDIAIRTYDEEYGELPRIPVVRLLLKYTSPQTELSGFRVKSDNMSFELPVLVEPKRLDLELHKTEVKAVIECLQEVLERVEKLEGGEAGV
jgi:hypothetical protein